MPCDAMKRPNSRTGLRHEDTDSWRLLDLVDRPPKSTATSSCKWKKEEADDNDDDPAEQDGDSRTKRAGATALASDGTGKGCYIT